MNAFRLNKIIVRNTNNKTVLVLFALFFSAVGFTFAYCIQKYTFDSTVDTVDPVFQPTVETSATSSVVEDIVQKEEVIVKQQRVSVDMTAQDARSLEVVLPVLQAVSMDISNEWSPLSNDECNKIASSSFFYVDPNSVLVNEEKKLRNNNQVDDANYLREISCYPYATWLTWTDIPATKQRVEGIVRQAVAQGDVPVFVTYQNPGHEKAEWYSGLVGDEYLNWNRGVAEGIGNARAWVVIEPDALGLAQGYPSGERVKRLAEIKEVVNIFKTIAPNARVYLDAGHSEWHSPEVFAELLIGAGIYFADGFATNISNYESVEKEIEQNENISKLVLNKPYIIDTSRNGIGGTDDKEWCNAPDRALGVTPTIDTGRENVDAFFWIKVPGESDGECNGGPPAGSFWIEYALSLVKNSIANR